MHRFCLLLLGATHHPVKTKFQLFRIDRLLIIALTLLAAPQALAQTTWAYDFGASTGTFSNASTTSTNFLPDTPTGGGMDLVRVGSGGGSFTLTNVSGFGSGSALVMTAPTSTSVNKFSIADWSSATTAFTLNFDMRLVGGTNGAWYLFAGNGATFTNANSFTGTESFLGLKLTYGTGGAITTSNRAAGNWTSFSSGISQSNNYSLSIYGNNGSSDLTYVKNGVTYTAATNALHIWVGNTLVGTNLAKAQLANGTAIDSFMFYGESSTGNLATNIVDNFVYANYLISEAIASALNWAGGSGNWDTGFGATVTNGSALSFSGSGGIATNNLSSPLIASMTFSNGASSYTVAGNTFTISNGIVNNSANAQVFSNAITLGAAQSFNAAAGDMTFAGDITNGGNVLTIGGASNTVVSGAISGAAGLTKSGLGTLTLSGSNSFTGAVTLNGGVTAIDTDGRLGNTANDITFGGGTLKTTTSVALNAGRDISGSGTFDIANGTTLIVNGNISNTLTTLANVGTLSLQGATRSLGNITLNAPMTLNAAGAINATGLTASGVTNGTATINPDIVFTTGTKTLDVGSGGALTLNGTISGATTLAKTGLGTLSINGSNSAQIRVGASTAIPTAGGTVVLGSAASAGSGQVQLNSGTLMGASSLVLTNGLSIGGQTNGVALLAGNNLEFQGQSAIFKGGGTTGPVTLNVNNRTTFSGGFAAASGSGTGTGITIGGSGTVIISGNSSALIDNITLTDTVKLTLNNTIGGNLTVGGSNTLGGNGTILGTLSLLSGAKIEFNALNTITVNGASVTFGGFGVSDLIGLDSSTPNGTYTIFSGPATVSTLNLSNVGAVNAFGLGGGKSAYFTINSLDLNVVPEPSTYALLVLSAAGLGAHMIRRRR